MRRQFVRIKSPSINRCLGQYYWLSTGVLVIENAMSLIRTQTFARRHYWAKSTEILHGTLQGDSKWDSREGFWNFGLKEILARPQGCSGWHTLFCQIKNRCKDLNYVLLRDLMTSWTNDTHWPHVTLVNFPPDQVAHCVAVGMTSAHMAMYHPLSKLQKPHLHIVVLNKAYHLVMSRLCNASDIVIFILWKHILTASDTDNNLYKT